MKKFLISVGRRLRVPLLIATGLLVADFAAADPIITVTDTQSNAELEAEIEAFFGPSMPWTTAGNLATIDYWLSLVPASADSDSLDAELAIVTEEEDASGTLPADTPSDDAASSNLSNNPEPATLVLLGSGLVFLVWGATTISSIRRRSTTS
jgi:hypothetical protein